ncbi:MAG: MFS transporter [Anaerolineae bacterium]|nr:MFS transporter [Anaerolineae bacterium]
MSIIAEAKQEKPLNKWVITGSYYFSFLILGCTQAVIGTTLTGLQTQTAVSMDMISLIFPLRSIGYMAGALLGGRLFDRFRGNLVFLSALVLLALGVAAMPFTSLFALLCAVVLLIGLAEGVIDVGGNTLLVWLHGSKVGPFLNGLHLSWGIGGLIIPQIVALSINHSATYAPSYLVIALISLPLMLILIRLGNPKSPEAHSEVQGKNVSWLVMLVIVVFFGFHVGAESSFGNWITTYTLKYFNLTATPQIAYNMASLFWFAFTLGRVLAIPFATRVKPSVILWVDLIGSLAGAVILLVFPGNLSAAWIGTALVGLFIASLFPMTIAFAERKMVISAKVTSMFFIGSTSGAMFFPWFIGQFFEKSSPQIMVYTISGCIIGAIIMYILLEFLTRKKSI